MVSTVSIEAKANRETLEYFMAHSTREFERLQANMLAIEDKLDRLTEKIAEINAGRSKIDGMILALAGVGGILGSLIMPFIQRHF